MATIARLDVLLGLKDEFSGPLDKSRSKLDSWGASMRKVGGLMTMGVTLPLLAAGAVAVKWAADLDEAMNKTNVLFDGAQSTVIEFSQQSAMALGISQQSALDFAGSFGGMLNTVAEGPQQLADMSTELTTLTADFASFHNLNPEQAFTVISSALAGEAEAIRRFGVDMSAANVEATALAMGLAGTASELTAQDKLLARYAILLNETTEEQGDFARTSNSVSNQMKIARARIRDVGTQFGRYLLPYVNKALDYFLRLADIFGSLDPKWQKIILGAAAFAAVMGPLLIIIGMMLPALSALGAVLAVLLSPIGLLVIAIAALIGLGIYAWVNDLWGVRDAVNAVIDALEVFEPMLGDLYDAFQALREGNFAEVWDELREAAASFMDGLRQLAPVARAALGELFAAIWEWAQGVDWGNVLRIAGGLLLQGLRIGAELGWELIKLWFVTIPTLVIGAIPDAISGFYTLLNDHGGNLMVGLVNGAIEIWNSTVLPWLNTIPTIVLEAVSAAQGHFEEFSAAVVTALSAMAATAGTILTTLVQTVKSQFLLAKLTAQTQIEEMKSSVTSKINDLLAAVTAQMGAIKSVISTRLSETKTAAIAAITSMTHSMGAVLVGFVGTASGLASSIGMGIVNGIRSGIASLIPGLASWFMGQVNTIIQAGKDALGIDSPSKVFADQGRMIGEGLLQGMQSMERPVIRAASELASATMVEYPTASGQRGGDGRTGGITYVSIALKSQELVDLIRKAENGDAFANGFGHELGLYAGQP